ncbi:MAG: M1 family metallopeptidase [Candidatus Micrarchaeia archaeon]
MENIIPLVYRIKVYPNSEAKRFDGSVEIDVDIEKPANEITLNAKELEIKGASIASKGFAGNAKVSVDAKKQELRLAFDKRISGRATIKIDYQGVHNEKLYGFYLSTYKSNGKEEKILTTQFESSDARAAFPCFDNPSMKAVFEITLVIDKDLDAISNMPVKKIVPLGKKKEVSFLPTPKMSTYLVYMGVGKFDYLAGRVGKTRIRVVTRPGQREYAKIPLLYAKQFISFYEKYFGIAYPLPKLDLIAIPDFSAGAMENWGAITFREIDLLVDPKKISARARRQVADTIAHELAHQWFGDLVTMKWWDDLWLNESFATYMSMKAVNSTYPNWRVDLDYLVDTVSSAMSADQLESTHPINVKVNTPEEIEGIFDSISYNKGGSVLRMLEDYLGSETFRKGLHRYLKKHAYSNATKFDLWNALDEQARSEGKKLNVGMVAKAWVDKKGFPLIKLSEGGNMLKQERFTILGKSKEGVWPVPITYISSSGSKAKTGKIMMTRKAMLLKEKFDWIKLNYGQMGFYRSAYPSENLELLGSAIKSGLLGDVEAWGIEGDLYAMLIGRRISLNYYLDFVSNYLFDSSYPLNMQLRAHLLGLYFITYGMGQNEDVRKVATQFLKRSLEKIGMSPRKGEDERVAIFRSSAISGLGMMGDGEIVKFAMKNLDKALFGEMDPNIRNAIYFAAASNGDDKVFEKMREAYLNEEFPEKKIYLLASLPLFRKQNLIKRALNMTFSDDIKLQDSYLIPYNMSSNPAAKEMLLKWIESNWKLIKKQFRPGTHMLGRFVESLSTQTGEEKLNEIKRFFTSRENFDPSIKKSLRETLEKIEINTKFLESL